ncbi:hypothetical protein LTR53_010477 [Teratosphaeriaceae sp. CCFEE 6253]|nr:hypothetical protein LTR53_010477 [Teratosphaeriaceae sp. CCFEE 6253]
MEHNAPHKGATFEGYYSKFDLPSGAHLAIIICQVKGARQKPYMLSFTYVPATDDATAVFQREIWADEMHMVTLSQDDHAFGLEVPGVGYARWGADSVTEYRFEHDAFTFHGKTTTRTPWSSGTETPEGLLVHLPLPMHWHVHSLASDCDFKLDIPSYHLPTADRSGTATVHQEKNWATSFPAAHIWLQARDHAHGRGFCCAGGQILGLEAFLLGYRSADLNIDFRPPFATRLAGLSPFMSYTTDWEARKFELSVQSFRQKVTLTATAPKGSFFALSSPFPEGHRENFLAQSFRARLEVKIYESGWFGPWRLVREEVFEGASLEFGGGYYPPAGSSQRIH